MHLFDIYYDYEEYKLPPNYRVFSFYITTKYDLLPEEIRPNTIISKISFLVKGFLLNYQKYGCMSSKKQIFIYQKNYIDFCSLA